MDNFTYVYTLTSLKEPGRRYTGLSDNIEARLKSHNQGTNPHTSK